MKEFFVESDTQGEEHLNAVGDYGDQQPCSWQPRKRQVEKAEKRQEGKEQAPPIDMRAKR